MQRISWIDVARGIGIILVLQGHALSAHVYRHFIYAFHMPLFFFISGLLFDYKKNNLATNLKKSVKGILIPYFIFALLSYFLWWIENANLRFEITAFLNHLSGILYGNSSSLFFNIVLWFLPCLFITKMGFVLLTNFIKNEKLIIFFLLTFSLLGYFAFIYLPDLVLPFGIESALTAIVFYGGGSILKTNHLKAIDFKINKNFFLILGVVLLVLMLSSQVNYEIYSRQIDIRLNNLGNYFLFYLGAISGIIFTVIISRMINKNYILEKIGKNALVLFVFHPFVFFYLNTIMVAVFGIEVFHKWKDLLLSPLYTIIAIVVILAMVFIYKKIKLSILKV